MRRSFATAVVAMLAAACTSRETLVLPKLSFVPQAMIAAVDGPPGLEVTARDLVHEPLDTEYAFPSGAEVTLLFYQRTLDAYLIKPGRLIAATTGRTRPLPPPDALFGFAVDSGSQAIRPLDALRPPLDAFRFANPEVEDCLKVDGCYEDSPVRSSEAQCITPCAKPSAPMPPADPMPPTPPEMPRLSACPSSDWMAVADTDSSTICRPKRTPAPIGMPCMFGQARFAGDDLCRVIGTACGTGDYATNLPAGNRVLYVHQGAAPGGDGSLALPFATIGDAVASAQPQDVIAISKGSYREQVAIHVPALTLAGACVESTSIAPAGGSTAAVSVYAPGAVVSNVALALADRMMPQLPATARGVLIPSPAGSVELDGVLIEDSRGPGVLAGGMVTGTDLVVRRATYIGLLFAGAKASLKNVVLEDNLVLGAEVVGLPPSDVRFDGLRLVGTRESFYDYPTGYGLYVLGPSRAEVVGLEAEDNETATVVVTGAGATATVTDAFVRATRSSPRFQIAGWGLYAVMGARAHVERARFTENVGAAMDAGGDGTYLSMKDVIADATTSGPAARDGYALGITSGALVSGERVVFENNATAGIYAMELGTRLELKDAIIRDTVSTTVQDGYDSGWGLIIGDSATATLTRSIFAGNQNAGLYISSSVTARDVRILRTPSGGLNCYGKVFVDSGGRVSLARALIADSDARGIDLFPDSIAKLSDVVIRNLRPTSKCESAAIDANGAGFTFDRGIIDNVTQYGIESLLFYKNDKAYPVHIRDLAVTNVGDYLGTSLGMLFGPGPDIELTRVRLDGVAGIGVAISRNPDPTIDPKPLTLKIADLQVSNTGDAGIFCDADSVVTATRALFRSNGSKGVAVSNVCRLTMSDVHVSKTTVVGQEASGLWFTGLATVSIERFLVEESALDGVAVPNSYAGASFHLSDGEVVNNGGYGMSYPSGFDASVMLDRVYYHANKSGNVNVRKD